MPARPDASATRALAWLYSPADQRPLFAALCGIEGEINASLRSGLDHQVAHTRLAWWREECQRCAQGRPSHPLTRDLIGCVGARAAAPPAALMGLVDAAVWDLAAATFATRRELTAYCERWAGAMIAPLADFGAPCAEPGACRALGAALREIELLCALAREARAGRLRL
ncbi:MAG: squalene/phytoene synthase family protein, partial [Steroidobacteraceae bacterium]